MYKIPPVIIQAVRGQLEQRASWLYLLCDEGGKRGLEWKDFGSAAIKRCGLVQGKEFVKTYGGKLKLLKSIARGDDVCRLYYHK